MTKLKEGGRLIYSLFSEKKNIPYGIRAPRKVGDMDVPQEIVHPMATRLSKRLNHFKLLTKSVLICLLAYYKFKFFLKKPPIGENLKKQNKQEQENKRTSICHGSDESEGFARPRAHLLFNVGIFTQVKHYHLGKCYPHNYFYFSYTPINFQWLDRTN